MDLELGDAGGGGGGGAASVARGGLASTFSHAVNSRHGKAFCRRYLGERKKNQCRLCVLILMKGNLHCVKRYESKMRPRFDIMLVSNLLQVELSYSRPGLSTSRVWLLST